MPAVSLRERFEGAVLGAAIGDALGHPTEFLSISAIRERWGPTGVRGFELWWEADGLRFAPYTDDTQMAEIVLRALVEGGGSTVGLDDLMESIATGFVTWRTNPQGGHRAPGNACMAGAGRLGQGVPWREAGGPTAGGCGSVMRAYPFGLIFWEDPDRAERWAVEHSRLTHGDPIALAACAALARAVAFEVGAAGEAHIRREMVQAALRYDETTAQMIEGALDAADRGTEPDAQLDLLRGWAAHEAIAAAAYVVARHPDDFADAVLEGANSPGDSDSIATLAGALLGTRLGISRVPANWVRDVERSQELLALARKGALLVGSESPR